MTYQLKNIRVLIVDNNQPIRQLLRSILLDLDIGMVDVANDAFHAWELYTQFRQDLLIVDWPVMDNRTVLRLVERIRRDPLSPNPLVPILLMTGFSNEERVRLARDTGITEFMMKPFSIGNLVRYLTHIVENPRAFIEAPVFVGPDRRRRDDTPSNGDRRGSPLPLTDTRPGADA